MGFINLIITLIFILYKQNKEKYLSRKRNNGFSGGTAGTKYVTYTVPIQEIGPAKMEYMPFNKIIPALNPAFCRH